ncbi:hypothetical protein EJ02DRAFT_508985 [Clathrospora elynae]|uniref:Uncharacterized protein n=1 Tax=Clathrospora elynae TaxID=706981 RepID=A0A6A5SZN3_9PLEO|nr:hypothetical protein EJ02DRAFT_508985 [Clathrospora elynae]
MEFPYQFPQSGNYPLNSALENGAEQYDGNVDDGLFQYNEHSGPDADTVTYPRSVPSYGDGQQDVRGYSVDQSHEQYESMDGQYYPDTHQGALSQYDRSTCGFQPERSPSHAVIYQHTSQHQEHETSLMNTSWMKPEDLPYSGYGYQPTPPVGTEHNDDVFEDLIEYDGNAPYGSSSTTNGAATHGSMLVDERAEEHTQQSFQYSNPRDESWSEFSMHVDQPNGNTSNSDINYPSTMDSTDDSDLHEWGQSSEATIFPDGNSQTRRPDHLNHLRYPIDDSGHGHMLSESVMAACQIVVQQSTLPQAASIQFGFQRVPRVV